MLYILESFVIDNDEANPRWGDASSSEYRRAESGDNHGYYRCIGGDRGDLLFNGYYFEDGETHLLDPAVFSHLDVDSDEIVDIAREIYDESYASIGIESIEHS